jgi:Patatin-like phospholipase
VDFLNADKGAQKRWVSYPRSSAYHRHILDYSEILEDSASMPEPLSILKVLSQEYEALRPDAGLKAKDERTLFHEVHQQQAPLTALCLSGGGIRSATFALGVIQGLADRGLLNAFDYLSTVSGGGYIGGWLTAWKQREGGIENVVPKLRRDAPEAPGNASDPVRHLREYNNYLSPKAGLLSADTWTLIATVTRNIFLNWMVFVPLLLAALVAPRLLLSLARLGETFNLFYGQHPLVNPAILSRVIPVLSALLFAVAIYNMLRYLPGVGGKNHTEIDFLKFCLTPLIGATVAFITNDSWFAGDAVRAGADSQQEIGYWTLTAGALASAFAGWIVYLIFAEKSRRERMRLLAPVSAAMALTGWGVGSAAWILTAQVYPITSWAVYTTLAVPLILLAMMFAGSIFVGFTSRVLKDEDREWLSRGCALVLLFVMCWTGICALVLILPAWAFTLPVWGKSVIAAVGGAAGWIGAFTGYSSETKPAKEAKTSEAPPPKSMFMSILMKLAAPVFAIAVLVALAMLTDWVLMIAGLGPGGAWWDHQAMLEETRWEALAGLGLGYLAFGWVMARFININKFSLQGMYRNRLIRAYLGASNAGRKCHDFTGFVQSDNFQMHHLTPELKPFHVMNLTLNLVSSKRLDWQQRKAESFTVTPLHCGSYNLDYRPSRYYGGSDGISLGTAVAISGAAASPNMGYNSSPVIGFIMTLFNARLGAWLGNPGKAGAKTWRQDGPTSAIASIVREAFGLTNDASAYVYLSDGGHFENLGIYEMVRRRCRYIVVSDSGCDLKFAFEDLGNALRKIRIDMKIPVDFEDGSFQSLREKKRRCAIARIRYSLVDDTKEDGVLLYIKPMVRGNEPPDVVSYQTNHGDFPHQSTADQFFDESQTESYRMLGLLTVDEICHGWDEAGGIPGLIGHIAGIQKPPDDKAASVVAGG